MEHSSGSQGGKSGGSHGSNNALPELRKANRPGCHPLRPHRSPMHGCDEPAVKWSESPLTTLKSRSYTNALKLLCTSTSWARIDLQMELAARKSCETLNPSPCPALTWSMISCSQEGCRAANCPPVKIPPTPAGRRPRVEGLNPSCEAANN